MGIYSNGCIYGVRLYRYSDEDATTTLFEALQENILTAEQMRRAYDFYTVLEDTSNVRVEVYTECSCTYNMEETQYFMMWQPMHVEAFLDKFGGDGRR